MAPLNFRSEEKRVIHINLARFKKGGENFEVPVNVNEAIRFKEGQEVNVRDVIDAPHIFSDAQKGALASEHHMKSLFGTSDPFEVAKIIITQGELQLTAEVRDKERQRKVNELIARIALGAIDPKTKLPHPAERIKLAMEEAKIRVDEFKTVDQQIDEVVDRIRPILPISFEKKTMSITIPGEYSGKAQGIVRNKGGIKEENWGSSGEWIVVVELPGGAAHQLIDEIKSLTHGRVEIKEI
jgi:ribosome maturation protein SDO1